MYYYISLKLSIVHQCQFIDINVCHSNTIFDLQNYLATITNETKERHRSLNNSFEKKKAKEKKAKLAKMHYLCQFCTNTTIHSI